MVKKLSFNKFFVTALSLIFSLLLLAPAAFASGRKLVPMGYAVGITLDTKGVVVVGYSQETDSPAKAAGIMPGDIITKIENRDIISSDDIKNYDFSGGALKITVTRGETSKEFTVTPLARADGTWELGLWLRDKLSGIGTVTYYDPASGDFGALGHPVSDTDTGVMIPMRAGHITRATINDIISGKCGTPGQLMGIFDLNTVYGDITENTPYGIFGKITDSSVSDGASAIDVAAESEIRTGSATIISTVNNEKPREYSVEIVRVDTGNRDGRSMMIKITDEKLLGATGGIVQGMSGSPIIQNGKLIGAVTHVLISDPTRGYGISLEKMTAAAGEIKTAA